MDSGAVAPGHCFSSTLADEDDTFLHKIDSACTAGEAMKKRHLFPRYLEVTAYDPGNCMAFVAGSWNGGVKRQITMGWCNSLSHRGPVMHELAHSLGMAHEQMRPDANQTYHGQGPNVEMKEVEAYGNRAGQYKPCPHADDTPIPGHPGAVHPGGYGYIGSQNDGPGDPVVGFVPYDYDSIVHYGGIKTVPTGNEYRENAVHRPYPDYSAGDIRQLNDMYQCVRKDGAPIPDPPPISELEARYGAGPQGVAPEPAEGGGSDPPESDADDAEDMDPDAIVDPTDGAAVMTMAAELEAMGAAVIMASASKRPTRSRSSFTAEDNKAKGESRGAPQLMHNTKAMAQKMADVEKEEEAAFDETEEPAVDFAVSDKGDGTTSEGWEPKLCGQRACTSKCTPEPDMPAAAIFSSLSACEAEAGLAGAPFVSFKTGRVNFCYYTMACDTIITSLRGRRGNTRAWRIYNNPDAGTVAAADMLTEDNPLLCGPMDMSCDHRNVRCAETLRLREAFLAVDDPTCGYCGMHSVFEDGACFYAGPASSPLIVGNTKLHSGIGIFASWFNWPSEDYKGDSCGVGGNACSGPRNMPDHCVEASDGIVTCTSPGGNALGNPVIQTCADVVSALDGSAAAAPLRPAAALPLECCLVAPRLHDIVHLSTLCLFASVSLAHFCLC